MIKNLVKSILHNVVVVALGFVVAFLGSRLDSRLRIKGFASPFASVAGWSLLAIGFLLRVWAAFYFYQRRMSVVVLSPQKHLVTTGPFRFSRNPLYLGGNVFIFPGASLVRGTLGGLFITAIHLPLVDLMIRREEKQLEQAFGDEWKGYKKRVRRWI